MVSIFKRMRRLKSLLDIRLGPGAALLPKDVKRIHMSFAKNMNDGHMGPRKFWHNCLPRLKYHNPAVPMTVSYIRDQTGPATMSIHFRAQSSADQPSVETGRDGTISSPLIESSPVTEYKEDPSDIIKTIDMKHKTDTDILAEFLAFTEAQEVQATPQEEEELRMLQEEERRSEEDRIRQAKVIEKRRREAEVLAQARRSSEGL